MEEASEATRDALVTASSTMTVASVVEGMAAFLGGRSLFLRCHGNFLDMEARGARRSPSFVLKLLLLMKLTQRLRSHVLRIAADRGLSSSRNTNTCSAVARNKDAGTQVWRRSVPSGFVVASLFVVLPRTSIARPQIRWAAL